MDLVVPTGIVEEFPCPRTGKILGSKGMRDILSLDKRIPGSIGNSPSKLSKAFTKVIVDSIKKKPMFWMSRFHVVNGELFIVVDIPDDESFKVVGKRWRARMVIRSKGDGHRIDHVMDVPAFWLEEMKADELP